MPYFATDLDAIRQKHDVPGLQALLFTTDGVVETAVAGVRKAGYPALVTEHDHWHIGSNTKAMTALLVGSFVAEGKLNWDSPVSSFFPEWKKRFHSYCKKLTLSQLLSHRSGLIRDLRGEQHLTYRTNFPSDPAWEQSSAKSPDPLIQQRYAVAELLLTNPPGQKSHDYSYSNTNYILAAAVLEKITDTSWESLIRERVFAPLHITTAGFGGSGTAGQLDQPWGHKESGLPVSVNGPKADNPPVMGPAGTVHLSAEDWAKFLVDQLRGANGMRSLLPAEIYAAMQSPQPDKTAEYGYGWIITERSWAGGKTLTHAGTNTLNYSVCWLAPIRQFGVLACANQGSEKAAKACDEAVGLLIKRHLPIKA
ncbi:MAG: hypothetical protein B9S32_01795 [Verrucomicrobia bacterium Tous-C9LFEB]|nr:MAG: hypothetical protein B9S32_01795 [Verrucomicrobia bacterium Tous-C9LFEB]